MNPDKCQRLFNGYRLYENNSLVEETGRVEIKLTWKQRLFSWPWQPMIAKIVEITYKPSKEVIVDEIHKTMHMHPSVLKELEKEMANSEQ